MAEREASEDFDYLSDDPADADGLTSHDHASEPRAAEEFEYRNPDDDMWDDPDDDFWDDDPESGAAGFDAFNASTWTFTPAPAPWYRTKQALTALIAAVAAMAAIVVSSVLLVFRSPGNTVDETTPVTPTAPSSAAPSSAAPSSAAPSSAAPATVATSAQSPPPPPPPPETSASSVNTAPDNNYPTVRQRPTKEPEFGVTRTPITRSPISVAPQPRRPS